MRVTGNAGNDEVHGGNGNDLDVRGGSGDDKIWGDLGDDELFGDTGADTYNYKKGDGRDIIVEKPDGNMNTLDLRSIPLKDITESQSGTDKIITISDGGSITIRDFFSQEANWDIQKEIEVITTTAIVITSNMYFIVPLAILLL